jgi:transcriptional regulator with XRE-family HTH domain
MARPSERSRSKLSLSVIELRKALGETQQEFAARLDTAITTIARYETSRTPSGEVLVQFMTLALAHGKDDLAELFRAALSDQLGYEVPLPQLGKVGLPPVPGEEREIEHLRLILRGAPIGFDPRLEEMRKRWYKLRQPIAAKDAKRTLEMTVITGLFNEIRKRISRGESDETITAALNPHNLEIVKKIAHSIRTEKPLQQLFMYSLLSGEAK